MQRDGTAQEGKTEFEKFTVGFDCKQRQPFHVPLSWLHDVDQPIFANYVIHPHACVR